MMTESERCKLGGGDPAGVGPAVWQGGAVSVERVVAAGSPGAGGDAAMMTSEGVAEQVVW
jgi:mono/diheme cytochrome c family protein